MTTIHKRSKPLSVSPLKASQTIGAALAFLGVERSVPLMHGAQGCTAFGKVFFVRHFREPIPLQTTAMDQISSVMGADENIVEGLRAVCSKQSPSLIGLPTTGLAETQGADIRAAVKAFRDRYPEYSGIRVVPVNTPDYSGCFESGYAAAVRAMVDVLVPEHRGRASGPLRRRGRVNVLAGSLLSVGDVEVVKELVEAFGLTPVVVPDLADSLDGHLTDEEFNPLTYGGAPVAEIETMGEADATLVVGRSLGAAADLLYERTAVPDFRFDHLFGLEAVRRLRLRAAPHQRRRCAPENRTAARPVARRDGRRALHDRPDLTAPIAPDPDLVLGYSQLLAGMGAESSPPWRRRRARPARTSPRPT